jgi:hypothetical protein
MMHIKIFSSLGDEFSNGNSGNKVKGKRMWGMFLKFMH